MTLRLPLPAIAICLLPLGTLQAQYPTVDRPARTLLVGRRETASVELARLGTSAMDDLLPWRHRHPPLTDGTGTSARLWSDLPVTIGTVLVPAGTYLLQVEAPGTLLITGQGDGNGFHGRVQLSERLSGVQVSGWALAVVTSRVGDDTLTVAEASVRGMNVTTIRQSPGTRSVLRLRYLDREWSVPIAAR